MDDNFKTSQTEFSGVDGQKGGAPAVQYGTEGSAPAAVTEPVKGEITKIDALKTSQQKAGEFSTPEGNS